MIRYIILYGSHDSGRSSVARELAREIETKRAYSTVDRPGYTDTIIDGFYTPIKHFFAAALGEKFRDMSPIKQRPELHGLTLEASLSQTVHAVRMWFGEDVLARWLMHRHLKKPYAKPRYVIIDDADFMPDIEAVPNRYVVAVKRPLCATDITYGTKVNRVFIIGKTVIDTFNSVKELAKDIDNGEIEA